MIGCLRFVVGHGPPCIRHDGVSGAGVDPVTATMFEAVLILIPLALLCE
jgi:hypothetical protein